MKEIKIPKQYMDMVGKKQIVSGNIFSSKDLKETVMDVIDIRLSQAVILSGTKRHPAVELLLKSKTMKKAQWSKPFPIREIKLNRS